MALDASTIPASFGGYFLMNLLAILLYGILSTQTYMYLSNASQEVKFAKAVVILVWILESIHGALVIKLTYYYSVTSFDHPENLAVIVWSPGIIIMIQMMIVLVIQSFYLRRVYLLSGRSPVIPLLVGLALLARVGVGMVAAGYMYRFTTWFAYRHTHLTLAIFASVLSLSVVVDGMIAGILVYYLHTSRPSRTSFVTVFHWMSAYCIDTGALPVAFSVASLITFLIMRNNLIYAGLSTLATKLYAVSLLGSLNSHHTLQEKDIGANMCQRSMQMSSFRAAPSDDGETQPHGLLEIYRVQEVTNTLEEENYLPPASPSPLVGLVMRFTAVVAALAALGCSSVLSAPIHDIQDIFARNDFSELNIRDGIDAVHARDLELGNQLHKRREMRPPSAPVITVTSPDGEHQTVSPPPPPPHSGTKPSKDKDPLDEDPEELERQLADLKPLPIPDYDDY
ncbi:hypothetical protein EIP91_002753 [Steccherinum ochraceum]|uniref:DUF6534 domain-containing protein n=1 Tax=Steccherinum ochraceum TaxID=92696 RepID=A0A4R0RHV9_9APHY|nr:hypothetical protein EIP91_002753 [Steccherinum ochraceum]